jgi:hypothetical protein
MFRVTFLFISILVLGCVSAANAILAFASASKRIERGATSAIIAVTIFFVLPSSISRHADQRVRWFVHGGRKPYDILVKRILDQKAMLSGEGQPLDNLVARGGVWGRTNADGSLTIWFQGRDGSSRAGYLYHNGDTLDVRPNYWHGRLVPLTNNWYAY